MQAVMLVRKGWSIRKVARYLGFSHGAVINWLRKAPEDGRRIIPTKSSRPHNNPWALRRKIVEAIIEQRKRHKRCGKIIHQELKLQGVEVSLSSVNRTLKRCWLLRERSPWKRWHSTLARPEAKNTGDLIQIDTIHVVPRYGERFYIYTIIDVCSRWAYAKVVDHINTHESLKFLKEAKQKAPFRFRVLQSDHGSEFSHWFTENIGVLGIAHRHSRVRQSNDNAHIERFNRTIQEECLDAVLQFPDEFKKAIQQYLPYYNNERLHLGINMLTPAQVVRSS